MPDLSRRFSFEIADFPELEVVKFTASEGMCELFQAEVTLVSDQPDLKPSDAVGKTAALIIPCGDVSRYLHGMICRFATGAAGKVFTRYYATVVPKAWALQYRYDVRIFQDLSVPDIVTKVLQGAGLESGTDFQLRLNRVYTTRTYCVQYRESDWSFVCRLLEDEGAALVLRAHGAGRRPGHGRQVDDPLADHRQRHAPLSRRPRRDDVA